MTTLGTNQKCVDCGSRSTTPLCKECTALAELLGYTAEERLGMLGVKA